MRLTDAQSRELTTANPDYADQWRSLLGDMFEECDDLPQSDPSLDVADAQWIRSELKMTTWREFHRNHLGVTAECTPTPEFWRQWRSDRAQIDHRGLIVQKDDSGWIVRCVQHELSLILLNPQPEPDDKALLPCNCERCFRKWENSL